MPEPESTPATAPARQDDLEIWVVIRGNPSEKFPEGLLITTRDRVPRLIAYVPRVDPPGILSAKRIASGKASPESEENLRGCIEAPARFVRALLVPMDYIEGRNRDCVGGSFLQLRPDSVPNFVTYTEGGFKAAYLSAAEKLKSASDPEEK